MLTTAPFVQASIALAGISTSQFMYAAVSGIFKAAVAAHASLTLSMKGDRGITAIVRAADVSIIAVTSMTTDQIAPLCIDVCRLLIIDGMCVDRPCMMMLPPFLD